MTKSEMEIKEAVTKRNTFLWILFLTFGGLVYITSYCFPDVVLTYNETMTTCPTHIFKHLGYDCADFNSKKEHFMAFEIDSFAPENVQAHLRFLLIYKDDYKPVPNRKGLSETLFQLQENAYIVDDTGKILSIVREKNTNERPFLCTIENGKISRCPVHIMTDLTPKASGKLILVVKLESAHQLYQNGVQEVKLAFQTFNPSFLKVIQSFKWILFIIAIASFFSYKNSISLLRKGHSSYENILVTLAGFSLILFNQPFLSYTNTLNWKIDFPYQVMACISIIIMQLQSGIVLYFWFYILQKLASNSKNVSLRNKIITKLLLLLHLTASFYVYYVFTRHQSDNGMADPDTDFTPLAQSCRRYLHFATVAIIAYSASKLLRIFPQLKELDWRDSTAFTILFCFVVCYLYFIGTGSLQTLSLRGSRVALLYGITTLCTVLLQFLYKPFEFEIGEAKQMSKSSNSQKKSQYQHLDETDEGFEERELENIVKQDNNDESKSE